MNWQKIIEEEVKKSKITYFYFKKKKYPYLILPFDARMPYRFQKAVVDGFSQVLKNELKKANTILAVEAKGFFPAGWLALKKKKDLVVIRKRDYKIKNQIKNIFVTGLPGCGKTTLIKEVIRKLERRVGGFFTSEIRKNGQRVGFEIFSLDGQKGILAHQDFQSPFKVSKYKVNLKNLEEIAVKSIEEGIKDRKLIVIDEIGKMELFSEKFRKAVSEALESTNFILGTITLTRNEFTDQIRRREDTKIFYLTKNNRQEIKEKILNLLKT
ncbi:MAG: NTPase [Patescibacteria group bacterium]|nr:NTPase [Patescibacteria group bacterium]